MTSVRYLLVMLGLIVGVGTANAGTYLSLGLGTNAQFSGDLGQHFSDSGGAGQFALGHRLGPIAVEAVLQGSRLNGISELAQGNDYSTISLGIQFKYFLKIEGGFEAYLNGGIQRNWLAEITNRSVDASGSGYGVGGGVQYSLRVPALAQGAIWLDFKHQELGLTGGNLPNLGGAAKTVVLGLSFGL